MQRATRTIRSNKIHTFAAAWAGKDAKPRLTYNLGPDGPLNGRGDIRPETLALTY
jgi:hypothetical protein